MYYFPLVSALHFHDMFKSQKGTQILVGWYIKKEKKIISIKLVSFYSSPSASKFLSNYILEHFVVFEMGLKIDIITDFKQNFINSQHF